MCVALQLQRGMLVAYGVGSKPTAGTCVIDMNSVSCFQHLL